MRADEPENWREKFNEVYKMDDGEALKRIAPPFIPERKTYYFKDHEDQARAISDPPNYFTFHWTGSSYQEWGYGFIGDKGMSLRGVLENVLDMKSYEFELPKEFEQVRLTGDWMVDVTTQNDAKLAKLCDIIRVAKGPSLKFVEKEQERPVIVVKGNYTFRPVEGIYDPSAVHLYVGEPDKDEHAGGGSGSFERFLQALGDRAGMGVVSEVEEPPSKDLSWRTHESSNHKELAGLPAGENRTEKIKQLLENVSKQTGLQLQVEQRKLSVWVAEPAPK